MSVRVYAAREMMGQDTHHCLSENFTWQTQTGLYISVILELAEAPIADAFLFTAHILDAICSQQTLGLPL